MVGKINYPPTKLPPLVVGNVGMYYVCYELSLRGWNVMPTSRNAKGIDIVAYNQAGDEFIGVQVKTLSGRHAARFGNSRDNIMGDWWVIVSNAVSEEKPNVFIMHPERVKELACEWKLKSGGLLYGVLASDYDNPEFADRWDLIGYGFNLI